MKQDDSFFRKLTDRSKKLSRNQRLLAKLVVRDYQKVAFTTIRGLAELSGTSEATIVRFVKSLGFKGYPDFQKEIRRVLRTDLKGNERFKIGYESSPSQRLGSLERIIDKEMENLSCLQETLNRKEFRKALSAIREAREILVAGTRSTASLATHFTFGLAKLGLRAFRITKVTTETYDHINRAHPKSLLVVIGFPRYLKELVDLLRFSKEKGVRTMTVTDSPFSPLAGDINLHVPAESLYFMAFHCAPLILINAILNELSLMDKEKIAEELSRFEKLAEAKGYFMKG